MNSSTRGTSSGVAGRIVIVSLMLAPCEMRATCDSGTWMWPAAAGGTQSSDALQPLGDAARAGEERLEEVAVAAPAGAPALQQVHLHQIHRIDVGIAQPDGTLQRRLAVEQVRAALQPEHPLPRPRVLGADLGGEPPQRLGYEDVIRGGDLEIGAGEHRFHVIDETAQEEPL